MDIVLCKNRISKPHVDPAKPAKDALHRSLHVIHVTALQWLDCSAAVRGRTLGDGHIFSGRMCTINSDGSAPNCNLFAKSGRRSSAFSSQLPSIVLLNLQM